jgi:hypothetical protein
MKKLLSLLAFFILSLQLMAQDKPAEMADEFRASGKIYVVVTVAAIVLFGLILYLVMIDRKVKKLEKDVYAEKKKD